MTLNPGEIQEVLSSLGYTLTDKGAYWQTNALFRNGDNKYLKSSERGSFYRTPEPETKIEMEEVYSLDQLTKLLPHYKFYNNKGISSSLLKILKAGLATRGQMYQRFVFPIFNQHGQIHGFSGRDMS